MPAASCDRCAWRRESPRTDDPPDSVLFEGHYFEVFARRLLLKAKDPRPGGLYACRCRTCGARWDVFACYSSSDNSPVPDTTWYEWAPAAWTDAQLQKALRALPQLNEEEKARAERGRAETAHIALLETIQLRRDQEARHELAAQPDMLPKEVYDQAAALVRSLRAKRRER